MKLKVYAWLDSLAELYPKNVTTFIAGYSHLGLPLKGIRIQLKENATRVALIDSAINAREWITVATSTYIANELLTTKNETLKAAAAELIWYILPIINPDGYNYTFFVDRLHRKNMQVNDTVDCSSYTGSNGIGTDLNRNFPYQWMASGGASDWPCSKQYAGPYPFSSPEARAFRSLLEGIGENLQFYLTLHSYAQLVLFPYGHTVDPIDNYYEQVSIYDDWVKSAYQTRLVFCYELRDTGTYGFLLPTDQIIPTAQEALASIPNVRPLQEQGSGRLLNSPPPKAAPGISADVERLIYKGFHKIEQQNRIPLR
ncbi:zinc carboxypeptidase-like [Agrilus planipennis]|uniref:Zinc carboxypeptidase-like n=1 Tax=Agrilus planipennis TaxID=224129 RepID=A0A7F5QY00_AGRPL|nr:zinc carboxypeptidase-like [Agrilus planipennis]